MLEIKFIRENLSEIKKALARRREKADLETFSKAEAQRREVLGEIEALRHKRNVVSEDIAKIKTAGGDADSLVLEMREVSSKIKALEADLAQAEEAVRSIVMLIPNMPHASVPEGKDESDNETVRVQGSPPEFDFKPKSHDELGEALGILDFKRAAKIAGARFPLHMGAGARLERALINFMLDVHTQTHGYMEVLPPFIVNRESMTGTGQLPKFSEDIFKLSGLDRFLIPTAEVPVTNIHRDETLREKDLPVYYTAYTPCFRSEAGSYGKDTKGLIRQHQFDKVELVKFVLPETSYDELEALLQNAEHILKLLEIPYRVVNLCAGDLGFSAAKTYDIEVWMPSQGVYREISSCSNFENFQARRANIRFKREGGKKTEFVHTLNGSGLAVGRTLAAILENFQRADGSVVIPGALRPFMGGMERLTS
ncbi:Serine--tRNA ligase [Candidatus Desulfarcum epimagneticum]|uniref:Serine--tRNA ligase n=1 Tax=uncultured Desulfobacteraceae bacterium TaxID=218296 RepID=A0A484HEJ0_9BACT|nr:Serine--tRNA ligase [uncultured Desulfobacteraceae bacterium]